MNSEVISRLEKWKNGKEPNPEKVQIYPTNLCNLRCIFCAKRNKDYGYEEELSREKWFEVAEEIANMNVNRVLISGGGEPFMKKNVTLEIMKRVKEGGCHGRLITNGTILDKQIREKTINMGWETVVFSVDGPNAKIHDKLRGKKGCFEKTMKNMKKLTSGRPDENSPEVEINFVLNNQNFRKLPEMIELCRRYGVSKINFEPITINNPFTKKLKINRKQRKILTNNIIPRAKGLANSTVDSNLDELGEIKAERSGEMKDEINGNDSHDEDEFSSSPCFEPWLWPKIEANGDIWPCSTTPLKENIKDKSFREIWTGKKFSEFRGRILSGDLPESCNNCVTTHLETNNKIRESLQSNK